MSRNPSPASAAGKSRGRSDKRRAIVDGAFSVFLADGYVAASMDRVADVAGVSKRTIYNHFASKDELFMEIVGSMVDEILDPIDNTLKRFMSARDCLLDFGRRYADVILGERRIMLHRLVLSEIARFPSLGPFYTSQYTRATRGVGQMLERLTRRGLLTIDDFEASATCFWQLTISESHNELLFAPHLSKEDVKLDERLSLGVDQFLKIYRREMSRPLGVSAGAVIERWTRDFLHDRGQLVFRRGPLWPMVHITTARTLARAGPGIWS